MPTLVPSPPPHVLTSEAYEQRLRGYERAGDGLPAAGARRQTWADQCQDETASASHHGQLAWTMQPHAARAAPAAAAPAPAAAHRVKAEEEEELEEKLKTTPSVAEDEVIIVSDDEPAETHQLIVAAPVASAKRGRTPTPTRTPTPSQRRASPVSQASSSVQVVSQTMPKGSRKGRTNTAQGRKEGERPLTIVDFLLKK